MHCADQDCGIQANAETELSLADRWITAQAQATAAEVARSMQHYRFDLASQALYEFIWNGIATGILELSKPVLWDEGASAAAFAARATRWSRYWKPGCDCCTRSCFHHRGDLGSRWRRLAGRSGDTIMLAPTPWRMATPTPRQTRDIEWLKGLIVGVRTIRSENANSAGAGDIAPAARRRRCRQKRLTQNSQYLKKLTKLAGRTLVVRG
ncbi:MAG: class I tRNA ligase family protein [Halioglobus sp.]